LAEQFDLVLCNPPYIAAGELAHLAPEVTRWDPRAALDGGLDGLDAYRALMPQLPALLAPGGRAVLETGCDQAEAVAGLARRYNLPNPWIRADLAGKARCVIMGGTEKDLGETGAAR
jgi:release factor glutamine methyltransferase